MEVVPVDEPVVAHFGECIACFATRNTSHEEASQQHSPEPAMSNPAQTLAHHVVLIDVLERDDCLLRSAKKVKALPQADCVQDVGIASVERESVRTYAGCLVNLFGLLLVNEATLDHPPSDEALESAQAEHADEGVSEARFDVAFGEEVDHGSEEDNSDRASDNPVEPLPEEDVFETSHVHTFVDVNLKVLRRLFILFELGIPLRGVHWRKDSVWLPASHGQARFGESGVAADDHDGKNGSTDGGKPRSDQPLFALDDVPLVNYVENDRVRLETVTLGRRVVNVTRAEQSSHCVAKHL